MGHYEVELSLSQEPATTTAELQQQVQVAWDYIYHRMTFGICMIICMRQYMPALLTEGTTLCIDVTVWTPLTVTCFFPLF